MRCYLRLKLLHITYKDHVTNEEVHNKIQGAIDTHDDIPFPNEEAHTQISYLKILLHGQDNSARDSKRNKKERKTEKELGRQHKGLDRTDWNLANLSEKLKIEQDGDSLLRRHLWRSNDH